MQTAHVLGSTLFLVAVASVSLHFFHFQAEVKVFGNLLPCFKKVLIKRTDFKFLRPCMGLT